MAPSNDRTDACLSVAGRAACPRAVVAIPVRNEAERIGACLEALAAQQGLEPSNLGVVLLLNNCSDETAQVVASLQPSLGISIRVIERTFAEANAGWARREAMNAAADWLEGIGAADGVILTTDADSRVPPEWVIRNLTAIDEGVDGVAGRIVLDENDAAQLPAALHARGRLEGAYETLLTEIEARIDPILHDPWPRHWTTSGATLAVRVAVYMRVGGMPPLAVGEDRAFVSSLLSSDARIRHDPGIVVVTSGRLEGRAPGGAADTMKLRCALPESPCDLRLESLPRALFRFAWRRRIRRLRAAGQLHRVHLWAPWLGVRAGAAREIARLPTLGATLAAVETSSPPLAFHPLKPRELAKHIGAAKAVVIAVRGLVRLLRTARSVTRRRAEHMLEGPAIEPVRNA